MELLISRLPTSNWDVQKFDDAALASDLVAGVCNQKPPIVVVVSVAPNGFPHVRYLSKRLRNACAEIKLIIGRWGLVSNSPSERDTLEQLGADGVSPDLVT